MTHPHISQADRDLLDDHVLTEPQPAHDEETNHA